MKYEKSKYNQEKRKNDSTIYRKKIGLYEKKMIFETHAHYDDEKYDMDREELLKNLHEENVEYIVNVSSSMKSVERTIELMKRYDFIYGAIGIHPNDCEELSEEKMSYLEKSCKSEKVVAIGEIGLDYYWKEPESEVQKKWFIRQLKLAEKMNLPVIIHSRDAAKDTIDILKSEKAGKTGGVVHCFSYGKEIAKECLNMGLYIGIGGVVTFQNAAKLKEVVKYLPLESIVLETDSPYLAPVPYRGKRNSSAYISYIAEEIGKIKEISTQEVLQRTNENAKKLYQIKKSETEE